VVQIIIVNELKSTNPASRQDAGLLFKGNASIWRGSKKARNWGLTFNAE
jgi:hypothetical protein